MGASETKTARNRLSTHFKDRNQASNSILKESFICGDKEAFCTTMKANASTSRLMPSSSLFGNALNEATHGKGLQNKRNESQISFEHGSKIRAHDKLLQVVEQDRDDSPFQLNNMRSRYESKSPQKTVHQSAKNPNKNASKGIFDTFQAEKSLNTEAQPQMSQQKQDQQL
jgi:hypothetical protein